MGPAVLLAGLVALSLLVLGATMRRSGRRPTHRPTPPFRNAVPWVVGAMVTIGVVLVIVQGVPRIVIVGLVAYTGVAVAGIWRMASLDRVSSWMVPSQRIARIGFTTVALTWLGIVLGLLLRIADMVASVSDGL